MSAPASPAYRDDSSALTAHLAQLAELEARGRAVLRQVGPATLAAQASDLYCALVAFQADAVPGADQIDSDPVEDLCALLQRLAHEREAA